MIMFGVGGFTCKERVMLIEREIQVTVLCRKVMFCHVQTCDETKLASPSGDCHKFVFGTFYWPAWQL